MPSTATQSYDTNDERRRARRLQEARATTVPKAANDEDYHDPKAQMMPQKGTVKAPRTITSTNQGSARAQDLKMRQRQANDSGGSERDAMEDYANRASRAITKPNILIPGSVAAAALQARKDVDNHLQTPWILAYSLALASDLLDLIPLIGWFLSIMLKFFLMIFMFGRGAIIKKYALKFCVFLLVDSIPIVGALPITTAAVFWMHHNSEKKFEEGKSLQKKQNEAIHEMSA